MEENNSQVPFAGVAAVKPAAVKPVASVSPSANPVAANPSVAISALRQPMQVQPVSEKACPVCGHINKAQSFMCEMCSNYLID